MKKYFIIFIVFLAGAAATFVYLQQKEQINHVMAKTKIWTENQPLIQQPAPGLSDLDIFVKIAEKFKPTVVNIHSTKTVKAISPFSQFGGDNDFFKRFFEEFFGGPGNIPGEQAQKNMGSGFVIGEDGHIITNNHVIEGADEIKIKLSETSKESFEAKLIGSDKFTDIALLKIDTQGKKLPVAPLGDSDQIKVGQWVAAIGHPFGYGHTVSHGIISAKERLLGGGVSHPYNDYIQTDASINLGNSGGPLISSKGEVIGINVATDMRAQGIIGFAIPINIVKDLLPQLIESGHAIRGFIGIVYEELTDELSEYLKLKKGQKGIVISEVIKGNPADLAGLKVYDVIIEFNGQPVDSGRALLKEVGKAHVGEKADIKIIRNSDIKTFQLKPVERKDETAQKDKQEQKEDKTEKTRLGMEVENISRYPGLGEKLGVASGVVVTYVEKDSPADKAGLGTGDIIIEINKKSIKDVSDYRSILSRVQKGKSYLFRIKNGQRGRASSLIVIKVE